MAGRRRPLDRPPGFAKLQEERLFVSTVCGR
jgi:hypothetical protein